MLLGLTLFCFLPFAFQVAPAILNAVTLVNGTAASEIKLPLIVVAFAAADGSASVADAAAVADVVVCRTYL